MAKKKPKKKNFDFEVGILKLAPAHRSSYTKGVKGIEVKRNEQAIANLKKLLINAAKKRIDHKKFPTEKSLFLFIIQYFSSEEMFNKKDLDNMSIPICNALEGIVYKNDAQIKTLLMTKIVKDNRIPKNFLYIAVKIINVNTEGLGVCEIGTERAFTIFQEVKKDLP